MLLNYFKTKKLSLSLTFLAKILQAMLDENRDITIGMSSHAGIKSSILLPWVGVFNYINQCCTAMAGGI